MSGELYFQWGVMIIVFIVHSLADSLMNFPSHHLRGTAQKLILMKAENCRAEETNFFPSIFQTGSVIVLLPSAPVNALNTRTQFSREMKALGPPIWI